MLLCNFHNFIHITSYTSIVNRNNHFSLFCNQSLNLVCINIRIVRTTICKYNTSTLTYKSQCRRYKSIAWHNYLITRFYITKNSSHFQSIGTRCCHQCFFETIAFFKKCLTLFSKHTITRKFTCVNCLIHVMSFLACKERLIKWNHKLIIIDFRFLFLLKKS